MRTPIHAAALATTLLTSANTTAAPDRVELQTNVGTIEIELFAGQAPITVANFLSYVNEGYYANTLFHRVIADFMIQGGGYDVSGQPKATHAPIQNEASNGISNTRGTIAMARTGDPNSATAQFFINAVDNSHLNYNEQTGNAGYAVFGHVVRGLDVADRINKLPTFHVDNGAGFAVDFPITRANTTVFIETAYATENQDTDTALARVLLTGTGKGKVTSDPEGLDCGATCSAGFPAGAKIALIAKAAKGSVFTGWRGDCQSPAARINVTLNANQNCSAVFTRK